MSLTDDGKGICELSGDAPRHIHIRRFTGGNPDGYLGWAGMAKARNAIADSVLLAAQDYALGLPQGIPYGA